MVLPRRLGHLHFKKNNCIPYNDANLTFRKKGSWTILNQCASQLHWKLGDYVYMYHFRSVSDLPTSSYISIFLTLLATPPFLAHSMLSLMVCNISKWKYLTSVLVKYTKSVTHTLAKLPIYILLMNATMSSLSCVYLLMVKKNIRNKLIVYWWPKGHGKKHFCHVVLTYGAHLLKIWYKNLASGWRNITLKLLFSLVSTHLMLWITYNCQGFQNIIFNFIIHIDFQWYR